jgi:hypothetical protein
MVMNNHTLRRNKYGYYSIADNGAAIALQHQSSATPKFFSNSDRVVTCSGSDYVFPAGGATVSKTAIAYQIIPNGSDDPSVTPGVHAPDHDLTNGNQTLLCKLQRVRR